MMLKCIILFFRMIFLIVLIFFPLIETAFSQTDQWNTTYGESLDDWFGWVEQTEDGGYIAAGRQRNIISGFREVGYRTFDVWLVNTDNNGNVRWNKQFGNISNDWANCVQLTNDGGFIIAGVKDASEGSSTYGIEEVDGADAWIIKTDPNGTKLWDKTFGETWADSANHIQQTIDGGYIIAGKYGVGKDNSDAWLIKIDAEGKKVWSNTFSDNEEANSVRQTSEGGYVLGGYNRKYLETGTTTDAFLIKTDSKGNQIWKKTFGGKKDDSVQSVRQTSDGGFLLAGYTRSYKDSYDDSDAWLIKTDDIGNVEWMKSFGDSGDERGDSVNEILDEGYILSGRKQQYGTGKTDAWLIRTDLKGNEKWKKVFGGIETDWVSSISIGHDGDFILAGGTYSYGKGSADAWLIKVSNEVATAKMTTPTQSLTHEEKLINTPPSPTSTKTVALINITGKTEPVMTDSSKIPGFEISFAVAVLLSMLFLMKRKN